MTKELARMRFVYALNGSPSRSEELERMCGFTSLHFIIFVQTMYSTADMTAVKLAVGVGLENFVTKNVLRR